MATGNLKYYLGVGAIADRPVAPDLYPDCLGIWLDDDTGLLSLWNGAAWEDFTGSGITDAPSDGSTYGRKNGAWVIIPAADLRFVAASFAPLVNVNNLTVFRHQFALNVNFISALTGSQFSATTAATASATYTIRKNGASIGTLVWAAAGTVPTVTFAAPQSFVAGDVLDVVGPAVADTTLAGITISFLGAKA